MSNARFAAATAVRHLAERAFSRAAGAERIDGNRIELLIDAAAHFDAWLDAIGRAQRSILLENYIIRDDRIGRDLRDALVERARAGVAVHVIRDWLGCVGQSRAAFWRPLIQAGGQVRVYAPPQLTRPIAMLSRDHRKMLCIDDRIGFLSGVCISEKWLGKPERNVPPWRDTGVALHGPALAALQCAFADNWRTLGVPLDETLLDDAEHIARAGDTSVRIIATRPATAGVYRLDQTIAGMARETLWLTDAYFVGIAPYVQQLAAAARDGVDVRLLVPGSSDIPVVAGFSRAGYRPLLEAGVRVFEWNGSMLHAKTAVADGQWARVGSSNLNLASWLGNCEIDVAVEDDAFAAQMQLRYEQDLENATEIVLAPRRRRRGTRVHQQSERPRRPRRPGGSSSRAAAAGLRLANTVGAALTERRVLGSAEATPLVVGAVVLLLLGALTLVWPAILGWPMAVIVLWLGLGLAARGARLHRRRRREQQIDADDDPAC
ncbi:phospholipase D-like domain-containing protein [Oleiagrimonas soli]|uniref:Cardiolipin synthase n=1 Tax=Oleiagrimonas soli TaxID=1543381 RepID=A0A099CUZ9_9GAMM|nr:phospholipase D-like domain-containing protein [Oleiagrimonas soli]KGI77442.1 phospholipase [Oleiagrimonas soli]MBB6183113.1 cardiolipin synthase [Oleiagrimonas soli]